MSGILDQKTDSIARGLLQFYSFCFCHTDPHPTHRNEANFPSAPDSPQRQQSRIKIREILRIARLHHCTRRSLKFCHQHNVVAVQRNNFFCFVFNSRKRFPTGMMVVAVAPHAASGLSCQSAPPPQTRLRCTLGRGLGARGQKPPARLGFAADADDDARHKS